VTRLSSHSSSHLQSDYLGLGSNSRCVANRSKAIGWNPEKSTQDLLASVKPEVEAILSSKGGYKSFLPYWTDEDME
jgi:hypothetical protein